MAEYSWGHGYRSAGINAQEAGEALESLERSRGRRLQAADVVKAARSKRSVLHDAFEWDDGEAAREYRLTQARDMIRHVVVVSHATPEPTTHRAYVHLDEGDAGTSYIPTVVAMGDSELREQMLLRALREANSWSKRYDELVELSGVRASIAAVARPSA